MSSGLPSSDMLYFTDRGSGPPLLLVHGLMVASEMFEPVVDQFAARHRVIVPDLRGHGRSRALPPPYIVRQLAADLSRLLHHLGIESTAVLGYSQGVQWLSSLPWTTPSSAGDLSLPAHTPSTWLLDAKSLKV